MDEAPEVQAVLQAMGEVPAVRVLGRVSRVVGLVVEVAGLDGVAVGEMCRIEGGPEQRILAEVVGFQRGGTYVMPYGDLAGVRPGAKVRPLGRPAQAPVGDGLLGRVIDAHGAPIDGRGPLVVSARRPLQAAPPPAMERARISEPIATGVRSIDGLLTLGRGQRMGIFAASGVGKSVLMGMVARNTSADVNVIALLGERGREVREFIERDLGEEGLARSIVVVATGDEGALVRARGGLLATAIAEHFRDQGQHVMLMVDSITRVAMAWREIGLAVGEQGGRVAYPPSVFARLPRLLERAGTGAVGSITGLYSVLVEGDDMNEPVADAARSILDGHIVLSSALSAAGHFPAIDVLRSKSRVRDEVITPAQREAADRFVRVEAAYEENADLIAIGQYREGAVPDVDRALAHRSAMLEFLRQRPEEASTLEETRSRLLGIAADLGGASGSAG